MYTITLLAAGLANGSLYALVALGLVLIYKAQDMVNFAHGEVFMAGAFLGFTAYHSLGLPYYLSFLIAIAGGALLGAVVERVVIRPIATHPHVTLAMATVGISFAMKGAARIPFGADIYTFPSIFGNAPIKIGPLLITPQSLVTVGVAVVLTILLFILLQRTSIGRQMRATQQNPLGARVVGIDTGKIYAATWAIASATGAAAGVLAAPTTLLYPDMGSSFLLKGFAAAVLGGFGSAPGAIVGGFLIGVIEMMFGGFISTRLIEVSSFLIIIIVMFVRPQGLFGQPPVNRV